MTRSSAPQSAAFVAVIAMAGGHQQAADIGEAQAQCAEVVGQLGDLRLGTGPSARDFQRDRPQACACS